MYKLLDYIVDPDDPEAFDEDAPYGTRQVGDCLDILHDYVKLMAQSTSRNKGLSIIENTVLQLGKLDDRCDGQLLKEDRKELILELILTASHFKGYNAMDEDLTEEWRWW